MGMWINRQFEHFYRRHGSLYLYFVIIFSRFFPSLLGGLLTIYYLSLAQTATDDLFQSFIRVALFLITLAVLYTAIAHWLRVRTIRMWIRAETCGRVLTTSEIEKVYDEIIRFPSRSFVFEAIWLPLTIPIPSVVYLYFSMHAPFPFLRDILIGGCVGIYATISFTYFLLDFFTDPIKKTFFERYPDFVYPKTTLVPIRLKVLIGYIVCVAVTAIVIGVPASNKLLMLLERMPDSITEIDRLRLHIVSITLAAVAISSVLSILLTRSLSAPIQAMVRATRDVRSGDLSVRTMPIRDDELGFLGASFNEMVCELEHNRREITLLNQNLELKVEERTRELQVANEQLQKLDRLKNDFFANISHELRTPLTTIRSLFFQMLEDLNQVMGSKYDDMIEVVISNTDRLLALVNGILDLAKLEEGKLELRLSPTLLPMRLADIILRHQTYRGEGPEIVLSIDGPDAFPLVYLDQEKFDVIISNLLGNAVKFSQDRGGDIQVRLINFEDTVQIVVKDFGTGIAPEKLERIFDRFYQAAEKSATGTGLGLSIVKEYMKLHCGEITVRSELGQGSEFSLSFRKGEDWFRNLEGVSLEMRPITLDQEMRAIEAAPLSWRMVDTHAIYQDTEQIPEKITILIVEDEPDVASVLKHLLEPDYNLVMAREGGEALLKLGRVPIDLVLSDIMMQPMNGFELLSRLQEDESTKHIPVILLTAAPSEQNLIVGFKAGARDYISKPFMIDELKMRIRNQLLIVEDRKRIERLNTLLIQSEKMASLSTYAGGIAHNIRNMILPFHASLDVLKMDVDEIDKAVGQERDRLFADYVPEVHLMIRNAQAAVRDIDALIRLMLDVYRMDSQEVEYFDLLDVVQQAIRLEKMTRMFHTVAVHLETSGQDFSVEAIKGFLSSALVELIKNAGDAISHAREIDPESPRGNVWIRLEEVRKKGLDKQLVVTIRDDGCGMTADVQKEMFTPLYTTKARVGTGLGLSTVYQMVEVHHGTIQVMSEPHVGTTFVISLPKRQRQRVSVL